MPPSAIPIVHHHPLPALRNRQSAIPAPRHHSRAPTPSSWHLAPGRSARFHPIQFSIYYPSNNPSILKADMAKCPQSGEIFDGAGIYDRFNVRAGACQEKQEMTGLKCRASTYHSARPSNRYTFSATWSFSPAGTSVQVRDEMSTRLFKFRQQICSLRCQR
jgi:hypothetical protein